MRVVSIAAGGIVVLGLLGGCAGEKARKAAEKTPPPPTVVTAASEGNGRVERHELTTVTATVVNVDQKTREVTLRGPEGNVETVHVGDEVRNLAQVHKGEHVVVKYYEAIAFQLNKKGKGKGTGKPTATEATAAERAPLGAKPAASAGRTVKVTTLVTNVDRSANTVSLKGPKGRTAVVHVQEPRYLENVKKGDTVDITYTEALAISVEPAP